MPQVAEDLEMRLVALCLLAALASGGCSIKKFAINKLGDSFANSGATFAADDDPELVGQALPFSLKLVEGLLAESPRHRGLLFAAASGFTQYAYVYVQQDADIAESDSVERATALSLRVRAPRAIRWRERARISIAGSSSHAASSPRRSSRSRRPSRCRSRIGANSTRCSDARSASTRTPGPSGGCRISSSSAARGGCS